jgi:hypothetical protein
VARFVCQNFHGFHRFFHTRALLCCFQMNPSAVFLIGTPTALAMQKQQGHGGVVGHILGSPHPGSSTGPPSNRAGFRQVSPIRSPLSTPARNVGLSGSPTRRHSMDGSTHLLLTNIRQRIEQASQFGLPLTDEELGLVPATASEDVDSALGTTIDEVRP